MVNQLKVPYYIYKELKPKEISRIQRKNNKHKNDNNRKRVKSGKIMKHKEGRKLK